MNLHKSEVFFYALSGFIMGVFLSSIWPISLREIFILVISGVTIIVLSLNNRIGILAGFIILSFTFGCWKFYSSDNFYSKLTPYIDKNIELIGYVDNEPEFDASFQRFVFRMKGERIMVTTEAYPKYKFGDHLSITGRLELPKNIGEFDYVTYLKKEGIGTIFFFPDVSEYDGGLDLGLYEKLRLKLYKNIFLVKEKFQTTINQSIPEPNASFVNGILLGSRQNIPEDLKEAFNKTGTTHILAISGYNIMIISWAVLGGLIYFFKRRIAFWISVVVIILFVVLTGASASVARAAIMGLILLFANGYGRLYDQKNSIILAGAIMIFINPFVLVFDVGFQLSFAAVLGLIYLFPYINSKFHKFPELGNIKETILMTFSAQVAVLPLILYYFGNFSPWSLPTNVLILPAIPMAMFFGFLTGVSGMLFLPLGQLFGYIAWAITSYQIWIVNFFS